MAGPLPIFRVKGMQMVMATAVPRPGRAPMTTPNSTPKASMPRQNGSAMVPNAWKMFSNMGYLPVGLQKIKEEGAGHGNAQQFFKGKPGKQREGYGWLVRGSFPSPAPYVQTLFPPRGSDAPSVSEEGTIDAQPTAAPTLVQFPTLPMPGGFLSTLTFQLPETPPRPEITDIAYAPTAPLPVRADGTLRLNAADLSHDFGVTVLDASGEPDGLQFRPGRDPASRAVHGPNRPLPLPAGTYRARLIPADPALDLRLPGSTPGSAQELVFPYDGTAFLDFEVHYNGNAPAATMARKNPCKVLRTDLPQMKRECKPGAKNLALKFTFPSACLAARSRGDPFLPAAQVRKPSPLVSPF